MRPVFRLLGVTVAVFFVVVFSTATFVFVKRVWFGVKPKVAHSGDKRVAVVEVAGLMTTSTATVRELDDLAEDANVKAIVVRINSPGGLVAPSQELYEAFKRIDKKTPLLVSMGAVAASGGYYAALGARKIYASAGTLTASVGVIMEFVNTQKLYEWAKVQRFAMTAGKLKAAGNEYRPMTDEERALFETLLTDIHTQFKTAVKTSRKISDEEVEKWCDGRVMSGAQAKAAKLVDAIGGISDAVAEAKKVAGLPADAEVVYPDKKEGVLRKLLFGGEDGAEGTLGKLWRLAESLPDGPAEGWRVLLLAPVH